MFTFLSESHDPGIVERSQNCFTYLNTEAEQKCQDYPSEPLTW